MLRKNEQIQEVFVKRSHILKGTQNSRSNCAIACAFKDHFKDAEWVQVWSGKNILVDNKTFTVKELDSFIITDFIKNFDINKSKCKPFSFLIKVIYKN